MAFKLDKQDTARRNELAADLREAKGKIEDAIAVYNAAVAEARKPLEEALAGYNEVVETARGWAEDIANQADNDISEKSDRWQESDKGTAATEWKDAWEGAEIEELEITFPDDISSDDITDMADILEALPVEAE